MKVTQLLEAKPVSATLIGSLLLKMHKDKRPMKVLLRDLEKLKKTEPGVYAVNRLPDQEWDITSVKTMKTTFGRSVRVYNTSPSSTVKTNWFELNPEDDEVLTIVKKDGYWLLTSRDGKGVKL